MKERIIITGYSGSLAKTTRELLKDDYEIIGLTSNKEKVNNPVIRIKENSFLMIFVLCVYLLKMKVKLVVLKS